MELTLQVFQQVQTFQAPANTYSGHLQPITLSQRSYLKYRMKGVPEETLDEMSYKLEPASSRIPSLTLPQPNPTPLSYSLQNSSVYSAPALIPLRAVHSFGPEMAYSATPNPTPLPPQSSNIEPLMVSVPSNQDFPIKSPRLETRSGSQSEMRSKANIKFSKVDTPSIGTSSLNCKLEPPQSSSPTPLKLSLEFLSNKKINSQKTVTTAATVGGKAKTKAKARTKLTMIESASLTSTTTSTTSTTTSTTSTTTTTTTQTTKEQVPKLRRSFSTGELR